MFLNPTMQYFTLLKTFQPLFNKHSRELVKRLDSFVDMEIDIYKFIESCSLDMLCGEFKFSLSYLKFIYLLCLLIMHNV